VTSRLAPCSAGWHGGRNGIKPVRWDEAATRRELVIFLAENVEGLAVLSGPAPASALARVMFYQTDFADLDRFQNETLPHAGCFQGALWRALRELRTLTRSSDAGSRGKVGGRLWSGPFRHSASSQRLLGRELSQRLLRPVLAASLLTMWS
jgi:hypothetical protein